MAFPFWTQLILHHGKFGCCQGIVFDLWIKRRIAVEVALDERSGIRMMEMPEPMQCVPLAVEGRQLQNFCQRFKHDILHRCVLAAIFSQTVATVPVIAERVPPHIRRGFEWLRCEKPLKQVKHGSHAGGAIVELEFFSPDNMVDVAIQIAALNGPKAFLEDRLREFFKQELRLCEKTYVMGNNFRSSNDTSVSQYQNLECSPATLSLNMNDTNCSKEIPLKSLFADGLIKFRYTEDPSTALGIFGCGIPASLTPAKRHRLSRSVKIFSPA